LRSDARGRQGDRRPIAGLISRLGQAIAPALAAASAGAAAVAVLAVAPTASAGSLQTRLQPERAEPRLMVGYEAAAGELNRVRVHWTTGGGVTISDSRPIVLRGAAGCIHAGAANRMRVVCRGRNGVLSVDVALGDGADTAVGVADRGQEERFLNLFVSDGPGNDLVANAADIENGPGNDVFRGVSNIMALKPGDGLGNDTIHGTAGGDGLAGGAGNDRIVGYGGADLIFGGPGADWIFGGLGNDDLKGEAGFDRVFGGPGTDRIDGRVAERVLG